METSQQSVELFHLLFLRYMNEKIPSLRMRTLARERLQRLTENVRKRQSR